jgi:dolichol-phosphate mannosyltransferase
MADGLRIDLITIVIPAKNEEATIGEIVAAAKSLAKEVIVVDGHSKDNTRLIAKAGGATVILDHGVGKGDAIRTTIPHINTPITVFMDADGSHDPNDIPSLVQPILNRECDHVSGSRLLGGSSELHGGFDEFFRLAGSAFITACINKALNVRLSDSQNGFRAIRTDVLRSLNLRENITTIEQEMIVRTLKMGYRMGEVPTHEYARRHGQSQIKLGKVWIGYGLCLFRVLSSPRSKNMPRVDLSEHDFTEYEGSLH